MGSLQQLHLLYATPHPPYIPLKPLHPSFQSLKLCSTMAELKQYHSQIIRLSLSSDNDAMGRLIKFSATSESGDLNYALKLFATMPHPDAFMYNTLIKGHLQSQLATECFLLYSHMLQEPVAPNGFTFPLVIRACCVDYRIEEGKQVHAHVFKFGYQSDVFSQNNLIHMYANFQCLEEAEKVFDRMPQRNVVSWTTLLTGYSHWGCIDEARGVFDMMPEKNSVSWNAMIAAYVRHNRFQEAFDVFDRMKSEKVAFDKYVAASMLSACTGLGALRQGEWIHGYIKKNRIELDSKLASTIIDMYCKCGFLEKAYQVFNELPHREISAWNSMIGGLALHGKGKSTIELLKEMEKKGVKPDYITFVNVLNACAHSGLVEEGRYYFHYMTEVQGIEPGSEHFGCMVDLLGRAGFLEEANKLINEMRGSPDASVLGALLGACRIHGNIDLGEKIGKRVIELDPQNSGRYVILSNMYADAGRLEDVARVRKMMDDRGVKKTPGFSMIELEGVVNEFVAGGRGHPEAKEIYAKVSKMLEDVTSFGYTPNICRDVEDMGNEEEKEDSSWYHSEKLAIALGLLKTKPGETLRITKNLRVCRDCHVVSKLISKVYNREIIVRDRNRFHHFKGGECSCSDYW